jgi:hypothetical protein
MKSKIWYSFAMLSFLKISVIATLVFLLGFLLSVLFDPFHLQLKNRDARRVRDVAEILSAVEKYISTHKNQLPANMPTQFAQIGSDQSGCEIHTALCQVNTPSCVNLHAPLLGNPNQTLPSDIMGGSFHKTKYAIQLKDETVNIVACGTEGSEVISVSKQFPGVTLAAPVATTAGVLK